MAEICEDLQEAGASGNLTRAPELLQWLEAEQWDSRTALQRGEFVPKKCSSKCRFQAHRTRNDHTATATPTTPYPAARRAVGRKASTEPGLMPSLAARPARRSSARSDGGRR